MIKTWHSFHIKHLTVPQYIEKDVKKNDITEDLKNVISRISVFIFNQYTQTHIYIFISANIKCNKNHPIYI